MRQAQHSKGKWQRIGRKEQKMLVVFVLSFFVFTSLVLVSTADAVTGINKTINFQGKLTNTDGTNVANNTYSVVFTLYDASSGGTNLWDETQNVTTVEGIFQVALGSVDTTLANVNFNSDQLYLGIKVGADSEMTPRIRFTAVPYAFNAHSLSGVVATQSATGFTFQGGSSSQSTVAFTTTGGVLTLAPGLSAGLTIQSNGANALTLDTGGAAALSIGTTNATSMVLGSSSLGSLTLTTNGTGDSEVQLPAQSIGASEIVSDGLDFTEFADSQTLDANTTISLSTLNYIFDLTSTGEFFIRDAGNNIAQFLADGTVTIGKAASSGTINLGVGTGSDTINIGTDSTVGDVLSIGNSNASTTLALTGGNDWSISAAGAAVLASVTGAGLSDCDAADSKILWNDATGTFSCGTEASGSGADVQFSSTTIGDVTLAGSATSLGTVSVTPTNNTGDVLVRLTFSTRSLSNTDQTITAQIRSGANCSGTILASNTTSLTSASSSNGPSVNVVYLHANAGNTSQSYTACGLTSSANGAGSTGGLISAEVIDTSPSSGGSGDIAVRESDGSPSVSTATTLEFGPDTTSTDEFIVSDQGSSIARVRIGNQVGMLNEGETVTGGWTFNTAATTFTTAINANGGIDTATDTDLSLGASGIGNIILATDADTGVLIGSESNTPAVLSVSGGIGSNAALILDQLNLGDLFTASASGVTRFTIDNSGNLEVSGSIALATGDLSFSDTGSIGLTGGTISDATDEVDIDDDLAVAGNISLTGTTGITFTGSGADLTFANLEAISNDTNGAFILRRNDAGTVTLTSADDDSTAALSITSGGASTLSLDTGGAAAVNIGTTNASGITIGNTSSSTSVTLTKGASGNIVLTGFNCSTLTNGGVLTADSNGYLQCENDDGGAATATYWDANLGALFPNNTTYDVLFGGVSTASAKFGFLNANNGATPVATISAPATGNALSLSANGGITTTKGNTLTLGGGDSGEVYTASLLRLDSTNGIRGGGLSDCDNPSTAKLLWDSSTNRFSCGTDQGGGEGSSMTVRESDSSPAVSAVAVLEFGPGSVSADEFIVTDEGSGIARVRIGNQVGLLNEAETVTGGWTFDTGSTTFTTSMLANGGLTTATDTNLALTAAGIGDIVFTVDANTGVLIGSDSNTPAPLSISGGIGNNAALIVNQQNSGNLFAASASGTTRFTIDNSGNIGLFGGSISDATDGVDIADDLDVSGTINLSTGNLAFSGAGNIVLAGGNISDSTGSVVVNDNLSVAGTTGITFTSTGGVVLAGGTISDSSGAVTVNDDISVSGSTGLTFSNTAAAIIFGNSELISNSTNGTLTFGRNDAGTVTLTAADNDATAALTITSGGAAGLTFDTGGAATLSIGETNASAVVIGKSTNGQTVTINTGTGGLNIGDTANTKNIEIGGVDADGGDTVRISTNATSADTITIGNANAGTTMVLTGGDDWSITAAGLATFTKLAGAGLSDCDTAATSKLLWDSTNQTFSCGTDAGATQDVVHITDAQNTTWADNDTTELWDGATQPNITPSSSNNELLIMVTIEATIDPANNGQSQPIARIDREIGSVADCTDVNTVGSTFGFGKYDNNAYANQVATYTFVDAPGTASNVSYTVCTSGDSVLSGTNTENRIEFTIIEVNDTEAADFAEIYPTNDATLGAGEVVSIDPQMQTGVMRSTKAYDGNVLGIVSTLPAITIGGTNGESDHGVPVALSGRVPVKVSTESGAILPGDLLTSSSIPGVAMKATQPGFVVGQAMTAYSGEGVGSVMVFVKNQWYDPDTTLLAVRDFQITQKIATDEAKFDLTDSLGETVTRVGVFAEAAIGNIQVGYAEAQSMVITTSLNVRENIITGALTAGDVTAESLEVTTENISIGGLTLRSYITAVVQDVMRSEAEKKENQLTDAVPGLLTQESGEALFKELLAENVLSATASAVLSLSEDVASSESAEVNDTFDTPDASDTLALKSLDVEGLATISSTLRVKNNGLIEGVLTVVDTLMTKNIVISGLATFFDNVVFKGDVLFAKTPTFSKDTAGFAVVKKGADRVEIVFDKPYEQLPVVNASVSLEELEKKTNETEEKKDQRQQELEEAVLGSNIDFIITKRTPKGFMILLDQPAEENVTFSWTALAVDEIQTFESHEITQSIPTPTDIVPSPSQAGGDVPDGTSLREAGSTLPGNLDRKEVTQEHEGSH